MTVIPAVSEPPVSPFTSVAPLVFVVTMTMLKQGYEDFKRHRADRVINQRKVTKLQDGGVMEIQSQEVKSLFLHDHMFLSCI
jgi:phospholipid-translocating ATPase